MKSARLTTGALVVSLACAASACGGGSEEEKDPIDNLRDAVKKKHGSEPYYDHIDKIYQGAAARAFNANFVKVDTDLETPSADAWADAVSICNAVANATPADIFVTVIGRKIRKTQQIDGSVKTHRDRDDLATSSSASQGGNKVCRAKVPFGETAIREELKRRGVEMD